MAYIARSNTGKFHRAIGPQAVSCNSRNRGLQNRPAPRSIVEAAPESAFCTKCFSGKPRAEILDRFYCEPAEDQNRDKLICECLNRFGTGQHPAASLENLTFFQAPYIRECVKRAAPHLSDEGRAVLASLLA